MQIFGTISDAVQRMALDNKWQRKKENIGMKDPTQELTVEDRQIQRYMEDMADIRESNRKAEIHTKLKAGADLTPDEIEYLRKNDPDALKEYEEIKREKEYYKDQLKRCKSKEDVEKLKMTRLGNFMAQASEISSNPNIPKGKKLELLERITQKLAGIQKEHIEFTNSQKYHRLPDKQEYEKDDSYKEEYIENEPIQPIAEYEGRDVEDADKTISEMEQIENEPQETLKAERQTSETPILETTISETPISEASSSEISVAETPDANKITKIDTYR